MRVSHHRLLVLLVGRRMPGLVFHGTQLRTVTPNMFYFRLCEVTFVVVFPLDPQNICEPMWSHRRKRKTDNYYSAFHLKEP
ncbi:Hypothetical protein, putative [Bodo saltans]|uniref:Uncharacterized protein n=1 Tax=Bodo saltans TaxID=75058 RepID=A0A0S4JE03_BODSA|nr:Hypothetical protein, putative [Bodo saltans]|eukprot:CUG88352.1 Hypothetical protein, putative [Bodo saltans]